jgi:N-ethylmaleimide reductase
MKLQCQRRRVLHRDSSSRRWDRHRNGGFDLDSANAAIRNGEADLVAFGMPFLANPDLPKRYRIKALLNVPDQATFYAGEDKGFTDYPALA